LLQICNWKTAARKKKVGGRRLRRPGTENGLKFQGGGGDLCP